MELLKDNYQRNRILTFVLIILSVVIFAQGLATQNIRQVFSEFATGGSDMGMLSRFDSAESFYDITVVLEIVASLAFAILLMMWMRRAYYNLSVHPNTYTEFAEGWAVGAWFVPFINLVRPYQIMREIWDKTQLQSNSNAIVESASLIALWWASHIGRVVLNYVSNRMLINAGTNFDSVNEAYAISLVADLVAIIGLSCLYKILVKMRAFEQEMYNNHAGGFDDISRHLTGESNLV